VKLTTILAGADVSIPSDQAIDRAAAIAAKHGAKLFIVHALVNDAPIGETDKEVLKHLGEVTAAVRTELAKRLQDKLEAVRAQGIDAELVTPTGPPGEVVAALAREHGAQLIVCGTHGHTGIQRFLLGSVAAAILRHAPCDVLVTRGNAPTTAFTKPLVAVDFSPASKRALRNAAALSQPNAPIEVIHAWQLPAGSVGAAFFGVDRFPWNTIRDAVVTSAKKKGNALVADNANLGHPIHVELVQGAPTPVITHAAEAGGHDLISIGTHGHGGFRKLLLGSVAEGVIRHANCSVLVVHGEHAGDTNKFKKISLPQG
jgi:nucleotide-binding universal stress UspA family protein